MKVPGGAETAKKWADQTPARAAYYEANTVGSGSHWEAETAAAAATFKQAIQAADIDKRFKGGVKRAGGAKFDRKVREVGVGRFGPGVAAAESDMASGIEPFLAVLSATEIKARGPRGDPGNYDIVKQVGDPLHKKRLALLAAGPA